MDENDWLARRFEEHRPHLRAVAYRMLGSSGEADDAVQEAWLRFERADPGGIENLGGWLTTVVSRICLDQLRSRKSRREEALDGPDPAGDSPDELGLADSVGVALLVVLDSLSPAERVAFVLHDLFDLPFDEIGPIVGRSAEATRQLASRARRRVRGASPPGEVDRERRREIVGAFLAASREGNFEALLAVLDPEVVIRADAVAVKMGAQREVRGAESVANTFRGRAQGAVAALVDGEPGAVWSVGGTPRVVFVFEVVGGRVVEIELVADPERIGRFTIEAGAD